MKRIALAHTCGIAFFITFVLAGSGSTPVIATRRGPARQPGARTHMALSTTAGWATMYGNSTGNELARSLSAGSDGGYILGGYSILQSSVEGRLWKLDAAGNLVWHTAYTGSNGEAINSIAATGDGGYIAAGNTYFGEGDSDVFVMNVDSAGNTLWQKGFGGPDSDGTISVVPASDGGFVIVGFTEILALGQVHNWVIKFDALGTLLWQKAYGDTNVGLRAITPTADGGYLIAGAAPSTGTAIDGWLLKLDGDGNVQWQQSYGGTDNDGFASVIQTRDGGYLAGGDTQSFGAGMEDAWLVKVDGTGTIVWEKTYGGSDLELLNAVDNAGNGGYIVTGMTRSFGSGGTDGWIMRVDTSGTVLWQNAYGGAGEDSLSSIRALSDGSYLAAGTTASFGTGNGDAWLLNVDANGNLPAPCSFGVSFRAPGIHSNGTRQDTSFTTASGTLHSTSSSVVAADSHDQATTQCQETTTLHVQIDIKPYSNVNIVNLNSHGALPVAILSSASFDVTQVDSTSICFGDAEDASQRGCAQAQHPSSLRDVNGDGRADLLLRFATQQTGIDPGDTQACLSGRMTDGPSMEGCDALQTK